MEGVFQQQEPPAPPVDQSYEAKMERSIALVKRELSARITALTLAGPFMPTLPPQYQHLAKHRDNDMVIGQCNFCNPPPRLFTCPVCDWQTEDKWRMRLHNDLNPKWCQERGARKVRRWAQQA